MGYINLFIGVLYFRMSFEIEVGGVDFFRKGGILLRGVW